MYAFWLPLWYLLTIVSSVLLLFMPSDYPFGIFWPVYRLSYFDFSLLIPTLVSCGHCIVCPTSIYAFWLPLWYLLAIASSVLLWFMPSDYLFGIFWPLYLSSVILRLMPSDYPFVICWPLHRLSYLNYCLLITPLLYVGHCIVCPTSINAFWLPLWYLLVIVSSLLFQLMPSDYPLVICWPLYRLSYFDVCLLITTLVSVGQCTVFPTLIYAFWLPLWYILASVSSVLLWFMPSDYHIGILWPLYRLSYFDLCLLITPLVSFGHCIVCPTLIYAFWLPLWYLLAIVSIVCPTSINAFWLPLCYMLAIVSSVLLWLMPSDYPFVICWPLYRLSYIDKCLLITPLVSFGHCIFCPISINAFWLPLSYMLAIVSSVLFRVMPSDYHIGIFWPLYRLSYFDLCLLITPLVSFGHCIVCPTLICASWLPLWYLLAIESSVLLQLMRSDYPFVICWPLYHLSYFDYYAFWLPYWYLLAIVSSVLLRFMPSDYPFGIFWPLYLLSYFN